MERNGGRGLWWGLGAEEGRTIWGKVRNSCGYDGGGVYFLALDLAAGGVVDNFNDPTPNADLWSVIQRGTVPPTVEEKGGRLEIAFPANAKQDSGGDTAAGYRTRLAYAGDFDARVDFKLLHWPRANGVRLALMIGEWEATERVSVSAAGDDKEAYVMSSSDGSGLAVVDTKDTSGSLRMVRQGNTVSGYYRSPKSADWIRLGSSRCADGEKPFSLLAWSHEPFFAGKATSLAFDNFTVTLTAPPETLPSP